MGSVASGEAENSDPDLSKPEFWILAQTLLFSLRAEGRRGKREQEERRGARKKEERRRGTSRVGN